VDCIIKTASGEYVPVDYKNMTSDRGKVWMNQALSGDVSRKIPLFFFFEKVKDFSEPDHQGLLETVRILSS